MIELARLADNADALLPNTPPILRLVGLESLDQTVVAAGASGGAVNLGRPALKL